MPYLPLRTSLTNSDPLRIAAALRAVLDDAVVLSRRLDESAAFERRCGCRASRRTRPCPPGTPRWSSARASGWAWRSRRRRGSCRPAPCGCPARTRACCRPVASRACCGRRTAGCRDRPGRRSRRPSSRRTRRCGLPRPLIPATAMRTRSLAPSTRPEAFVPAMANVVAMPAGGGSFQKGTTGLTGHGQAPLFGA